jgi:hypothetical protein
MAAAWVISLDWTSLRVFIGAGAVNASYKEEAMDLTVSGHKPG